MEQHLWHGRLQTALMLFLLQMHQHEIAAQVNLDSYFGKCQRNSEQFDECVKNGINALRPVYHKGLPYYRVAPLDPFFIPEIQQSRSGALINYRLILRNVTESGWAKSHITQFKSNLPQGWIQYTQSFPDKRLNGQYEIEGTFFGRNVQNSGHWNLSLFDYVQTTTVSTHKNELVRSYHPYKVRILFQNCGNMELHISHLVGGRLIMERIVDWLINRTWQPGIVLLSPLINDLVSRAFEDIINKNFKDFPFNKVFRF